VSTPAFTRARFMSPTETRSPPLADTTTEAPRRARVRPNEIAGDRECRCGVRDALCADRVARTAARPRTAPRAAPLLGKLAIVVIAGRASTCVVECLGSLK
jgi:hypothetical protein